MNQQLITDISDVFILDPLRNFLNHPATWPTALLMLVYMIWQKLHPQSDVKIELGDPAWDAFFQARGFTPKHFETGDNGVIHQWCATRDGIDWLIDDSGRPIMMARSLTIWLSSEIQIAPEFKAQEFQEIDLMAWVLGRCRRVELSPQQTRRARPSYSHEAGRLAPILGKVAPLEWQPGPIQVLLEKRRLKVGFEIGRYVIDDAMLAAAARDFGRILGPFGAPRILAVPYPDGFSAHGSNFDNPTRLKQPPGTGTMLAALAATILVLMLTRPFLTGSTAVPLIPILGVGTYLLAIRLLR